MAYIPQPAAEYPVDTLDREFKAIAAEVNGPVIFTRLYALPTKAVDGQIEYLDVSIAGIGATGLYRYDGTVWNLLG